MLCNCIQEFIFTLICYVIVGDGLHMATMPPPPTHTHLSFLEPWDILNTKSNVNIENIGMETLF